MKLKLSIGVMLVITLAAGLWLWLDRPAPPAKTPVGRPVDLASLVRPSPANAPKLKPVAARPANVSSPMLTASDGSAVQTIMDVKAGYETRLRAIGSLAGHLSDADWNGLQPFLLQPDGLDKTQLGQVIKNELLDALCALNPPPAGLGEVLTRMYHDQQQNEVIRDYAVQHLGACYEQVALQPDSTQALKVIQDTLWEAVNETSDSIGGTALLALKRLSQEYPGFDQNKIAATALQMAGDNQAGELTQITAYQVCAQLAVTNALPLLLAAAQNGPTIPVKMSAIGALGRLGGAEQILFLNRVLAGSQERLKPAAQHALEQIQQTRLASRK